MITEWRFLIIQSLYHSEQRFGRREPTAESRNRATSLLPATVPTGIRVPTGWLALFRYFLIEKKEIYKERKLPGVKLVSSGSAGGNNGAVLFMFTQPHPCTRTHIYARATTSRILNPFRPTSDCRQQTFSTRNIKCQPTDRSLKAQRTPQRHFWRDLSPFASHQSQK